MPRFPLCMNKTFIPELFLKNHIFHWTLEIFHNDFIRIYNMFLWVQFTFSSLANAVLSEPQFRGILPIISLLTTLIFQDVCRPNYLLRCNRRVNNKADKYLQFFGSVFSLSHTGRLLRLWRVAVCRRASTMWFARRSMNSLKTTAYGEYWASATAISVWTRRLD